MSLKNFFRSLFGKEPEEDEDEFFREPNFDLDLLKPTKPQVQRPALKTGPRAEPEPKSEPKPAAQTTAVTRSESIPAAKPQTPPVVRSEVKPTVKPVIKPPTKTMHAGSNTQLPGITAENRRSQKQLVIGLDFGTAFTKVVVGEDRFKLAIPLSGKGDEFSHFLCPTTLWKTREGQYSLFGTAGAQFSDLKMALIDGNFGDLERRTAAIYLAYIFRRVRAYVFTEKKTLYEDTWINWIINVGLPTDSYHNTEMVAAYNDIMAKAWMLSIEDDTLSDRVFDDLSNKGRFSSDKLQEMGGLFPDSIQLFPEFAAQVTGYVRSPLRREGLHALVDVGAGTLDITVFNVFENDDSDLFPIFAKGVEKLGTRLLVRHRIGSTHLREQGPLSPFQEIPSSAEFAELLDMDDDALNDRDQPFRLKVIGAISKLLIYTKRKRDPKSRKWIEGVPFFLCGGGSHCDFYLNTIFPQNRQMFGVPIERMYLPRPESLEGAAITESNYDRLSVAYGLAFEPFDIGEVLKEEEISDFDLEDTNTKLGQLCPRCRGGDAGLHTMCPRCGGSGYV